MGMIVLMHEFYFEWIQKKTLKSVMIIFARNGCRRDVKSQCPLRSALLWQRLPFSRSLPSRTHPGIMSHHDIDIKMLCVAP